MSAFSNKARAMTAATVIGLGGIGAYALATVPDAKAPSATSTTAITTTAAPPVPAVAPEQAVEPVLPYEAEEESGEWDDD